MAKCSMILPFAVCSGFHQAVTTVVRTDCCASPGLYQPEALLLRSPATRHRGRWNVLVLQFLAVLGIDRFGTALHRLERDVVVLGGLVHEGLLARQIVQH